MKPLRKQFVLVLVAVVFPPLLALTGLHWQHRAIETFAAREGHHDLFQTWVGIEPLDYTYDYRGNNLYYETWAIRIPFIATTLSVIAFVVSIGKVSAKWGLGYTPAIATALYSLAVLAFFTYRTFFNWLANSGIFI